jgi:predicted PurR-regulated permease PerM
MNEPSAQSLLERALQLAGFGLLMLGCIFVVQPFLVSLVFAGVVAMSSWSAFEWILARVRGRKSLAAVFSCVVIFLILLGPIVGFSFALAQGFEPLWQSIRSANAELPPELPEFVANLPMIGSGLVEFWQSVQSEGSSLGTLFEKVADPARDLAIVFGRSLGTGATQIVLALFFLFFMYRDGAWIGRVILTGLTRLAGDNAPDLLRTAKRTVLGVMLGMIGTAAAQGCVATLGFFVAGVPGAPVLGALTFFASLLPVGPPLIWGGAAIWLWRQDQVSWAVFMAAYGIAFISSVDNLVKPLIISRTSALPLPIALVGVAGGVLAFGLAGIFVGPTLLALVINLSRHWLDAQRVEQFARQSVGDSFEKTVENEESLK